MTWKTIDTSDMWDFKKEGKKILEGIYMGSEFNKGPKANSAIHTLESEGEEVKIWGGTVLDGKFDEISKEYGLGKARVKITYEGKKKGKTGTEYNAFSVAIWEAPATVKVDPVTGEDLKDEERINPDDVPF